MSENVIVNGSPVQEDQGSLPDFRPDFRMVVCPFCQADEIEHRLELQDWGYGGPGIFSLVTCKQCDLRYLNPRPTPDQMDIYYPPDYAPYRPAIEDERWALMRWMRRRKVIHKRDVIERFSGTVPGTILDIGCSTGIFLAEMQGAGWATYGVELNQEAATYARQRFGLTVYDGYLSAAPLLPDTFDAVTMWDVLEHTFEPLITLQQIHSLLQPGGIVVAIVPNDRSLDRHLFGPAWVGYDAPRHLTVFSPQTLQRMIEKAGFEVIELRCGFGGYFSFVTSLRIWLNRYGTSPHLRKMILRLVNFPGMRLPFEPFFKMLDLTGWGNELLVIGRKPH